MKKGQHLKNTFHLHILWINLLQNANIAKRSLLLDLEGIYKMYINIEGECFCINNPATAERFKNLKSGDILKLRDDNILMEEEKMWLIMNGWNSSMYDKDITIVFGKNALLKLGIERGWSWSLDMFEYANPYAVELI